MSERRDRAIRSAQSEIQHILLKLEEVLDPSERIDSVNIDTRNWGQMKVEIWTEVGKGRRIG